MITKKQSRDTTVPAAARKLSIGEDSDEELIKAEKFKYQQIIYEERFKKLERSPYAKGNQNVIKLLQDKRKAGRFYSQEMRPEKKKELSSINSTQNSNSLVEVDPSQFNSHSDLQNAPVSSETLQPNSFSFRNSSQRRQSNSERENNNNRFFNFPLLKAARDYSINQNRYKDLNQIKLKNQQDISVILNDKELKQSQGQVVFKYYEKHKVQATQSVSAQPQSQNQSISVQAAIQNQKQSQQQQGKAKQQLNHAQSDNEQMNKFLDDNLINGKAEDSIIVKKRQIKRKHTSALDQSKDEGPVAPEKKSEAVIVALDKKKRGTFEVRQSYFRSISPIISQTKNLISNEESEKMRQQKFKELLNFSLTQNLKEVKHYLKKIKYDCRKLQLRRKNQLLGYEAYDCKPKRNVTFAQD